MATGLSSAELRSRNPNLSQVRYRNGWWILDSSHPSYSSNVGKMMKQAAMRKASFHTDESSLPLYREAEDGLFYQIENFRWRPDNTAGPLWGPKLKSEVNAQRVVLNKSKKDEWRPILRMLAHGDPEVQMRCPLNGHDIAFEHRPIIDGLVFRGEVVDNMEGHHIVFNDGVSQHKEDQDPSKLLLKRNPWEDARTGATTLLEVMTMIYVSASFHRLIHTKRSGCLADYSIEERPWFLRSRGNWDKTMLWLNTTYGFNITIDYKFWLNKLGG